MRDVCLPCKSFERVFSANARRVNLAAFLKKPCHIKELVRHAQMGMYRLWASL